MSPAGLRATLLSAAGMVGVWAALLWFSLG
jgi:hypothetical protein